MQGFEMSSPGLKPPIVEQLNESYLSLNTPHRWQDLLQHMKQQTAKKLVCQ